MWGGRLRPPLLPDRERSLFVSHVSLIAADKELSLCDRQEHRESTVTVPNNERFTIGFTSGFAVTEHSYYRDSVDFLDYEMKPFRYELTLEQCEADLSHLLAYLRENFSPGEEVELWSLWVDNGHGERPIRYRGRLSEFDLDILGMLTETQYEPDLTGEYPDGLFSQICITIEV